MARNDAEFQNTRTPTRVADTAITSEQRKG